MECFLVGLYDNITISEVCSSLEIAKETVKATWSATDEEIEFVAGMSFLTQFKIDGKVVGYIRKHVIRTSATYL